MVSKKICWVISRVRLFRGMYHGPLAKYSMKAIRSSRTNLERTTSEGILIEQAEKESPGILMNSKSEGGRGKLVRYAPRVTRI